MYVHACAMQTALSADHHFAEDVPSLTNERVLRYARALATGWVLQGSWDSVTLPENLALFCGHSAVPNCRGNPRI